MSSVNTNYGALVALQSLNQTNRDLATVQSRVNTGLKVASARDNGAVFAIGQSLRSQVAEYNVKNSGIDRAISTVDVAATAADQITDVLRSLLDLANQANDTTITDTQRIAVAADFVQKRNQINTIVASASFNGKNLINTGATAVSVAADLGTGTISTAAEVLQIAGAAGANITITTATVIADATSGAVDAGIAATITALEASIANVSNASARLGGSSNVLTTQKTLLGKLADATTNGLGLLVDADLAKESANLQALQIKQQLGAQALSIANQQPQILLSFFRQ